MASTRPSNDLQGLLYLLSSGSTLVIALLGLAFLAGGPAAGGLIFGFPVANGSDRDAASALVAIIGVRDITLAFLSFMATYLRDRRSAGLVAAAALVATVGDAIAMAAYSLAPAKFITAHVVPAIPLALLCAALLKDTSGWPKIRQA